MGAALARSLGGRAAWPPAAALACMGQSCAVYLGGCPSIRSTYRTPVAWRGERTPGGQLISKGGQKSAAQT